MLIEKQERFLSRPGVAGGSVTSEQNGSKKFWIMMWTAEAKPSVVKASGCEKVVELKWEISVFVVQCEDHGPYQSPCCKSPLSAYCHRVCPWHSDIRLKSSFHFFCPYQGEALIVALWPLIYLGDRCESYCLPKYQFPWSLALYQNEQKTHRRFRSLKTYT